MKSLLRKASNIFAGFAVLAAGHAGATTFTIDSLDGDITANEISKFVSSINTLTPPTNNWGDNLSTHGTAVEGMRRMYEATGNIAILNRLIVFCDIALVHRNDEPLGEHRIMWDGTMAPAWPESSTSTTPACSTGEVHGNIAYCALLILQTPSIWNTTVPDGNPYGYGVTYKQRALTYLSKVDQGLSQYLTVWFVNPNTFRIQLPQDSRWLPASGNDTAETAWNRQALFVMAYQFAAECHDLLADHPAFLPTYKAVVNSFATWFVASYPSGGGVYYTSGGHNVVKWYYNVPTDQHIENIGHAQHDIIGLYQAWESRYSTLTRNQVQVYADTTQFAINLGSVDSWAGNVDGTGTPTVNMKSDFVFLGQWNAPLYKMIAQSNIDGNQLNGSEGCKNTGYILWMKHWMFVNSAGGFSLAASPSAQTVISGSNTTFTVTLNTNISFAGPVTLSVTGLPSGAGGSFSPTSMTVAGNSTLTVTTTGATPLGSFPLTITGTNSAGTNTVTVTLNVVVQTGLFWSGASVNSGNWSDSNNWNGQTLAPGATLTFQGVNRLANTNDTASGTLYSNIVFSAGSGAFTLAGNPITLKTSVTNNSLQPQEFDLGLSFSNSISLNGANDELIVAGGITNTFGAPGSTTLTLAGIGTLVNLLASTAAPGGSNIVVLNSSAANWSIADNASSLPMTAPWVLAVNNGILNFGDDADAPVLTLTTPNNTPQDNQVGAVSGGTGTLNINNGTLTTSSRFNTATVLNSTGIINQAGGTFNMGSQFQGANGSSAGEVSTVNLSGGIMRIASGTGPFFVASRGSGTLTLSGGTLLCGKLDISRNAAGNTVSSIGVVNLSGGTLSVQSITNISANQQTGGSPTATFNFDGGTLVAAAGAAPMFFQGSRIAPVTPIRAYVKDGGALIDDGGLAITIGEPLLHDPALGGAADGGLTKSGAGTLTLASNNTYNGSTLVNAGTLALGFNGSISNSPTINVAGTAVLDATTRSDGQLTLITGQTLTGGGALKGNVVAANGAVVTPADINSALSFSNNVTLNGGSTTTMEISKSQATNNALNVAGLLTYGGTLNLAVLDGTLTATDHFKLFSAGNYTGAFTNIIPATPGAGLTWNTNTLVTDGTLRISVFPPPQPSIAGLTFDGANLILSGTNGPAYGTYYVLCTTNIGLPVSNWTCLATNLFDASGSFLFTNAVNHSSSQWFFRLQLP
jgi:autotransporter-associated beta strand protein